MKRSRAERAAKRSSIRRGAHRSEPALRSIGPAGDLDAQTNSSETRLRIAPPRTPVVAAVSGPTPLDHGVDGRSVVIVVNDAATSAHVSEALARFGFDVVATVSTGRAAVDAVQEHRPDVALVDVCLESEDDGVHVAAEIRALHATPVVFLATSSDDATLMRAKEQAQPYGYVLRPYHDGELRAAMEVALQRHKLELEMQRQRALLAGVLGGMSDAVITADAEGRIVLMNDAGRLAFGDRTRSDPRITEALVYLPDQETLCPEEEMPLARALRGDVVRDQELFVRSPNQPDGRWYSVNAAPLFDAHAHLCGAVAVGRDVTDVRAARSALQQLAQTDALTGAYNRWGFMQTARAALDDAHRSGSRPVLFYIDLDGMKHINDSLGHHEGDRLLVDFTSILRACFRTSDIVGRLGGDEFVVFAPDAGENAEALCGRLRSAVETFNNHSDRAYRISMCIGMATCDPGRPAGLEELVEQADRRMYEEKVVQHASRLPL